MAVSMKGISLMEKNTEGESTSTRLITFSMKADGPMVKWKVTGIWNSKVTFMKGSSKRTRKVDTECNTLEVEIATVDSMLRTNLTAKENISGLMEHSMLEISDRTTDMIMENGLQPERTLKLILAFTQKEKDMEVVSISGEMDVHTMAIFKKI